MKNFKGEYLENDNVLHQPIAGYSNEHKSVGIPNISENDLDRIDLPYETKRSVIIACRECGMMGIHNKCEYAKVLKVVDGSDADSGLLTQNNFDSVDITDWEDIFTNALEDTIILIHNHTNGTFFSVNDIEQYISKPSVKYLFVVAIPNVCVISAKRNNENIANDILNSILGFMKINYSKIKNWLLEEGNELEEKDIAVTIYNQAMESAFATHGIFFERW